MAPSKMGEHYVWLLKFINDTVRFDGAGLRKICEVWAEEQFLRQAQVQVRRGSG